MEAVSKPSTTSDGTTVSEAKVKVNRDSEGEPLGITVCFTDDDLEALGIDPETTEEVIVTVRTDGISIDEV